MLLFPCVVTLSNGSTFSPVSVYATPDGTDVWVWDRPSQKAVVLVHGPGMIVSEDQRDTYTLTVDDCTPARIVYDPRSCGCGHPLKHFRPSTPVRTYAPG